MVAGFKRHETRARNQRGEPASFLERHAGIVARMHDEGWARDPLRQRLHVDEVERAHDARGVLGRRGDALHLVESPLLLERGIGLVEVADEEFETMGTNVLALAPRRCLVIAGNPLTRRALEAAGCEVLEYEGTEISAKGSGGPTCLTRPLVRSDQSTI